MTNSTDSQESNTQVLSKKIEMLLNPKWKYEKTPIFVECNDYVKLLEIAGGAINNENKFDVFFQRNPFFSTNGSEDSKTWTKLEMEFNDYCNFFDKHKTTSVAFTTKRLIGYSNHTEMRVIDYPIDVKMIIIFPDFNLWDLNSQLEISKISEKHDNILVIGQIRSDLKFARKHLNLNAMNRGMHINLIEVN